MREQRQREATESFQQGDKSIIKAAPRFGKIKTSINIMERIRPKKVLIVYPRNDIQEGWESDFKKWEYPEEGVEYTTYKSLYKRIHEQWDLVILDEIHEASVNQLMVVNKLRSTSILGLSGTITVSTENNIYHHTKITPCYEYTINDAVREGILSDYKIFIHKVPLDTSKKKAGKSESERFKNLDWVYKNLTLQKKDTFHIYLKQIQLIQSSYAKKQKTRDLLEQFRDVRVLVFCGTTEVADDLGCNVYHSKSTQSKDTFLKFCRGEMVQSGDNHLATIKMAQAGITVKPINKGIINYTSGNPQDTAQKICRLLGLEYDNPEKKAEIHIICSTEKFELDRMSTALMFFDKNKIFYK